MSGAPDPDAVADLLAEAGQAPRGALAVRPLPGGASRDLWVVADDGAPRWVLRRDAPGEQGQTSRAAEFEVQRRAFAADVPVPRPVACEPEDGRLGTAGMLMAFAEGEAIPRRVLRDPSLAAARDGLARELGAALRALREVPVEGLGTPPADPAAAALAAVREQVDATGDALPALELGLRWLELHRPAPVRASIVHGDFRLANFLIGPEGLRAVIDWEFWHLGDPAEDLAWVCARPWRFGAEDRPVAGCGPVEDLLSGFGEAVEPARLRWWDVLSQVKWGAYCAGQAALRRAGAHASLERTVLARRVAEAEWDALALLEAA